MIQIEFTGYGSLKNLKRLLDEHNPQNIFLVTGKNSYDKYIEPQIADILKEFKTTRFCDFKPNPNIKDVEKGIEVIKKGKVDFVVSIGGGSVIDVAKVVNILSNNPGNPTDYVTGKNKIKSRGTIHLAIPTTSGSGSEVTSFAAIYVGGEKYSLDSSLILPNYSIVDPSLTVSLPKEVVAASGMDALCQAIESYWSIHSTDKSKEFAKKAIKLVLRSLDDVVNNPDNKSRADISEAAHLAGKAINITRTTAPHALSYAITSQFGIPHGHAVALTLENVLGYNALINKNNCADSRGVAYVKRALNEIYSLLNSENENQAKKQIARLMCSIGLKTKLGELGITGEDKKALAAKVNQERLRNNPRKVAKEDIVYLMRD